MIEPSLNKFRRNFNKYIQLRDIIRTPSYDLIFKCLACGRWWLANSTYDWKDAHASHYYLENEFASVRFDEDNVHICCSVCNKYKHGNLALYQENLIKKIGNKRFEALTIRKNKIKHWDEIEIEKLNKIYLKKISELKKEKGIK